MVDKVPETASELLDHLQGVAGPGADAAGQDAGNLQPRVEALFDDCHRVQELGEAVEGQDMRFDRNRPSNTDAAMRRHLSFPGRIPVFTFGTGTSAVESSAIPSI